MCTGWQLALIIIEIISVLLSSYVIYITLQHRTISEKYRGGGGGGGGGGRGGGPGGFGGRGGGPGGFGGRGGRGRGRGGHHGWNRHGWGGYGWGGYGFPWYDSYYWYPYLDSPEICYKYVSSEKASGSLTKQQWKNWANVNNVSQIFLQRDKPLNDYAIVRYIGDECTNDFQEAPNNLDFEEL